MWHQKPTQDELNEALRHLTVCAYESQCEIYFFNPFCFEPANDHRSGSGTG